MRAKVRVYSRGDVVIVQGLTLPFAETLLKQIVSSYVGRRTPPTARSVARSFRFLLTLYRTTPEAASR